YNGAKHCCDTPRSIFNNGAGYYMFAGAALEELRCISLYTFCYLQFFILIEIIFEIPRHPWRIWFYSVNPAFEVRQRPDIEQKVIRLFAFNPAGKLLSKIKGNC